MTTFVNSAGATVSKLLENGKLWVAEQLPPDGDPRLTRVRAVAEESDDLSRLTTKWLQKMGLDVPRERELCLAAGMNDCLFKPIGLARLRAALATLGPAP